MAICGLNAWDEDPRIEEHNDYTSYLMQLGDRQVAEKDSETMKFLKLMAAEIEKLKEKPHE